MLRVLDLFSGIGAYSLGLQRTGGFVPVAFCEIDPFCRRNLRKNWPSVAIYEDVKALTGDRLRADGIVPDWIVAGWPCQGNSPAGTGLGMDDSRSGLWSEIRRLAGEIRPRGLLLENSSNLLNINDGLDFGQVLGDLAALRMHVEWHCLPAAAYDAPHIRDRVWIIATATDDARDAEPEQPTPCGAERERAGESDQSANADIDRPGLAVRHADGRRASRAGEVISRRSAERVGALSDVESVRLKAGLLPIGAGSQVAQSGGDYSVANADRLAPIGTAIARQERVSWQSLSDFRGVVHGDAEGLVGFAVTTEKVPNRVERIHALGNLNPPIIPEAIGRAILAMSAKWQGRTSGDL